MALKLLTCDNEFISIIELIFIYSGMRKCVWRVVTRIDAITTRRRNMIWLLGHDVEGFTAEMATRAFTVTRPDVDWKL